MKHWKCVSSSIFIPIISALTLCRVFQASLPTTLIVLQITGFSNKVAVNDLNLSAPGPVMASESGNTSIYISSNIPIDSHRPTDQLARHIGDIDVDLVRKINRGIPSTTV